MIEESGSLFPATGPLPAGLDPAAGESIPPPPWWAAPVPLALEGAVTRNYLTQRRAMDLLKAGRFAEALALFEQFLGVDPDEENWLFLKGSACWSSVTPGRRSPRWPRRSG